VSADVFRTMRAALLALANTSAKPSLDRVEGLKPTQAPLPPVTAVRRSAPGYIAPRRICSDRWV